MADIGLDAADGARDITTAIRKQFRQGTGLHGIFTGMAATMGLNEADICRVDPGIRTGALQGRSVGHLRRDNLIDSVTARSTDTAYYGIDAITVPQRIFIAFQDQGRGTLPHNGAIGLLGKGPCHAARRPGTMVPLCQYRPDLPCQVHRTHDRRIEFATLQGAYPRLQRTQAGTLFIRYGKAGATDTKCPRHAARHDPAQGAHGAVGRQGRTSGITQVLHPLL